MQRFLEQVATVRHFTSAVVLGLAAVSAAPCAAATAADAEYQYAVGQFHEGRFSQAFGKFMELANQGDVDAARVALFMSQNDAALFGKQWDASAFDVARWTALVRSNASARAPFEYPVTVLTPDSGKTRHANSVASK